MIDLTRALVFEPASREVPFSDEAAEMCEAVARAASLNRPLLVILRERHIERSGVFDTVEEALAHGRVEPQHLRCPAWLMLAHTVWVLAGARLGDRIIVLKDGDPAAT